MLPTALFRKRLEDKASAFAHDTLHFCQGVHFGKSRPARWLHWDIGLFSSYDQEWGAQSGGCRGGEVVGCPGWVL